MALFDHRVFKHGKEWWVAQVHGQNSGVTTGPPEQSPMTHDFVFFTSPTVEKAKSKVAFVPSGKLNTMSHRSIVRVLGKAEDFGSRREMEPYNLPSQGDYVGWNQIVDEEDLRWVFRPNRTQAPFSSLELVCLDDSALRRTVLFQDSSTLADFAKLLGDTGNQEVIKYVKGTFEEIDSEPMSAGWQPSAASDTRVREWMRSKGMEVAVTNYDFSREVYAWRDKDAPSHTLRISQEVLEDWAPSALVTELERLNVDGVIKAHPKAYVLIKRKGGGLTIDKRDFPPT